MDPRHRWHRSHVNRVAVLRGTDLGTGAGVCGTEDGVDGTLLRVGVGGAPGAEIGGWRGDRGSVTLFTLADCPRTEPEGTGCVNAFSTSLSYNKLNVVAKNGASLNAILWMCSMSNLESFSVKLSWRNWISMSMTALWLKKSGCEETNEKKLVDTHLAAKEVKSSCATLVVESLD